MCGRYVLKRKDLEALLQELGVKDPREFASRYNIAPGTVIPAIRATAEAGREAVGLQWGLVPWWSKDAAGGARLANARAEGIARKPSFREALRKRRCVVPASGFYEWQTVGRAKQPWYFHLREERPFVFAALWESWRSPDGVGLETCSLITTTPNELIRPIHVRMPVILPAGAVDLWLDRTVTGPEKLEPLLIPFAADAMVATPVSTRVNSVRNEGPECLEPATPLRDRDDGPQLSLGLG
ncbi:MAG: SOS response-associated peptidase [Verrucomicrobia bacterium]|nr:SOS response-associated peptidase [Verrucomicrobiota bacterium]